jgi:hypothetical protein
VRIAIGGGDDLVWQALIRFIQLSKLAAHEALDGENGVAGVGHGLALGCLTDDTFAAFRESDDGRRGTCAFGVFEHRGLAAFEDGHAGVGGAEVNAEDFAHDVGLGKGVGKGLDFGGFTLADHVPGGTERM